MGKVSTMAAPPNPSSSNSSILHATYTSPNKTHTFAHTLSTPLPRSSDSSETPAKTAYLSELRGAVSSLQTEVNEFLTTRMDEDNSNNRQASGGGSDKAKNERERREEENYGEEVLDDAD
ncbi:hypothetical protein RJZ56_006134 [Blastomyces dermatitidis]|uniref:EKC/KEOPS complex subunit GON7 n=3 Tax=Blastomyces TaxID=229219 RepID=A0A179UQH1_BLAGS|nr:uncharacterized protein BDBG_05724 [Blastomyces gilchristii SLH14081]XP_045274737.1 uncharacterized protein BDCG_02528 [Blastomyces dermatitidis ER-3]EGE78007.2 hypothetical protein BDDG_00944 [Blastomyces dermatitidis ATCC 18188]EQL38309.1 hypothetical protein BDFG_00666 [Blastomyces dermatitidis ATCC 26199]EEQ87408.2 hypothetical protein BDCG_02528 [Blastomyces dermatitidis ER-3]OAT10043.1 hypothetical protein BDBG_05724 [Blastomyces gilchristii SLH14081]